jgi:CoA:oxalate CoA-transferase
MALTGYPRERPMLLGSHAALSAIGVYVAIAAATGLLSAQRSGAAQHVVVSGAACLEALTGQSVQIYHASGKVTTRRGYRGALTAVSDAFECSDGYWVLSVPLGLDGRRRLMTWMDDPVLANDASLEREGDRMPKRDMILDRIEQWSRRHQKRDLAEQAQARGIPASPVSTTTDLAQDPQLLARRFRRGMELLNLGPTLFPVGAVARKMDAALGTAPRLGEHTQSFFGALGWASRSARIWAARDSPLRGSHSLEMLGAAFGWVATSREVGILGLLVVVYRTIFRDINAFE